MSYQKFFKSEWPAIVMVVLGLVAFIAGNFFGCFMPESWLTPLAWFSSMSLCVGLLLGAVAYGLTAKPFLMTGSSVLVIGGGFLTFLWLVMAACGLINEQFVDLSIFSHPSMGALSVGILVMGVTALVSGILEADNKWRIVFVALCGGFLISVGLIMGGAFWVLPLGNSLMEFLGYVVGFCFLAMIVMIVVAIFTKKVNYL